MQPWATSTGVQAHAARLSCLRHANPETGPVYFRTRVRGKTAKILDSYAWGCYNMGRTLGDASRCHRPVMPEGRAIVAHPETCPRQARTGPGRGTHIRAFPFPERSIAHASLAFPALCQAPLEQRRRRHRRTRRLWGTGLLLGLGLLLGGGWVLLRLVPGPRPGPQWSPHHRGPRHPRPGRPRHARSLGSHAGSGLSSSHRTSGSPAAARRCRTGGWRARPTMASMPGNPCGPGTRRHPHPLSGSNGEICYAKG